MSTFSTLIIYRDESDLKESIAYTIEGYVDADVEVSRRSGDGIWVAAFDTKFTVDGLEAAAEDLSDRLFCKVDVLEEWDNRDADEQGREAYTYLLGKRVTEERTLEVPAGEEVVVLTKERLREWARLLEAHPFPEVSRVLVAIDAALA